MIRRPPRSTLDRSSAASDVYKRQVWIIGEDLVQTDPNTHHVRKALEKLDLLIVQELFMSETAKMAHVILPGASFLELSLIHISEPTRPY